MLPHVAERRARFVKLVKGTLGVCVAVCFVATVVSIFSGGESAAIAADASRAPSLAIVSVEKLDRGQRRKAFAPAPQPGVANVFARKPRR